MPTPDPVSDTVAGLQLFRWQSNLSTVSLSKSRLKPLPPVLRWVLALLLILNGTAVTPVMGHAATDPGHGGAAHSTSMHCHGDAAAAQGSEKDRKGDCSCCFHGDACQCARVVASVLPLAFSDLRPVAPQTLTDRFRVAAAAAAPLPRLLRPPI